MSMVEKILPCPICGDQPDLDEQGPLPNDIESGWYAVCYKPGNDEHYVGADGNTRKAAIAAWNKEVRRHADAALSNGDEHG